MSYILIIVMTTTHWGTVTPIEFNSREACLAAAKVVQENTSNYRLDTVYCVPKGIK